MGRAPPACSPAVASHLSYAELHLALGLKDGRPPGVAYDPRGSGAEAASGQVAQSTTTELATVAASDTPVRSSDEYASGRAQGAGSSSRRMYWVCHAWEGDFLLLVLALDTHCRQVCVANPDLRPADITYFLDAVCLDQSWTVGGCVLAGQLARGVHNRALPMCYSALHAAPPLQGCSWWWCGL